MEDFMILLITLIVYLVSGRFSRKKANRQRGRNKGSARRGPMRTSTQGELHDAREVMQTRQMEKGFADAFSGEAAQAACDAQPLHLREVTQAQLDRAREGEDPCHGGVNDTGFEDTPHQPGYDEGEANESTMAQDILRGVIMSEILTKPRERMAAQRSRR